MSNVILFFSDEHNPFYSSVYGHPFVQTPNMERLAAAGTVYENTYCPSPLCLPCRASFVSGRYVHETQVYNNLNRRINSDQPSYGRELDKQDVHTVHVGKMDVFDKTANLGFSEYHLPGDRENLHAEVGRNPLMQAKNGAARATRSGVQDDPFKQDLQRMDVAIDWLENTAPTLDKPWVLIISLIKPHFPHYVTQDLWDMYADYADLPDYGKEVESAQHPYAEDLRHYFATDAFTEENVRNHRRGYYGCVTFIDQQLGRVMDIVEQSTFAAETNIIYTSDHGEMLGKFGMWWKCSLYEDSARIPCIAAGPDFAAGKRIKTNANLLDVQATFFDVTGSEQPDGWQGDSLRTLDNAAYDTRIVFSEYHGHGTRASAFMVRKGDWKYIHYADAPNQLFNLQADPDELNNLLDAEPEIVRELDTALREICSPEKEQERAEAHIQKQLEVMHEIGAL